MGTFRDMTGVKINSLTGIKRIGYNSSGRILWLWQCDCGKTITTTQNNVYCKSVKTCGHCEDPQIGDKVGKFTIVEIYPSKSHGCKVAAICECGRAWKGQYCYLIKGHRTRSCGHCKDPKIGDRFGSFTIIKTIPLKPSGCNVVARCDCGTIYKGSVKTLRAGQKSCGCLNSAGELKIAKILTKYHILFKKQKSFDDLIGVGGGLLRFDFYLSDYDLLIEYQGEQHYDKQYGHFISTYAMIQKHDKLKRKYCKQHNIDLLEIPYTDYDNIEEILVEKLGLNKAE